MKIIIAPNRVETINIIREYFSYDLRKTVDIVDQKGDLPLNTSLYLDLTAVGACVALREDENIFDGAIEAIVYQSLTEIDKLTHRVLVAQRTLQQIKSSNKPHFLSG